MRSRVLLSAIRAGFVFVAIFDLHQFADAEGRCDPILGQPKEGAGLSSQDTDFVFVDVGSRVRRKPQQKNGTVAVPVGDHSAIRELLEIPSGNRQPGIAAG